FRPARVPRRRAHRGPLDRPDRLCPPPPGGLLHPPPAGRPTAPPQPRRRAPTDHPMMTAGDLPMRPFRRTRTHLSTLALSLSLALGAAVLPAAAQTAPDAGQLPPPANAAEARLRELYEAEWLWRQQEFARERIDGRPGRTSEAPFIRGTCFWGGRNPRRPSQGEADWRRFIGRLRDVGRYFDEHIANMEGGLARGWSVPRSSVEGRDKTIEPYTLTSDDNPFLATFANMPVTIKEPLRSQLQAEGRKVVLEHVVPAYSKLLSFMREEYLPRTRTTTAAADLPNGREFYRTQIKEYVTRDMTAKEIHELGLAEVERISREMREVMKRAGFEGSFEEFLQFLRTDPQFYAKTPNELLYYTAWIAKKVDGELKHVIGTLPRYRFTILPVPDDIAPIYTSGRGGLDSCLFNTYDLPQRPLYNLPALVVHECAPGHSFQAALALEAPARPDFRQQTYFSGYGEGWGLYTEWLGTLMGIYQTPYDDFGRLTFEMWRAARLVTDTGLHAYGWTRQQAIDYLTAHTALAPLDIVNEIDRYIAWPGQALAYYIGYKTIRDLRAEAERELGDAFDQRPFHDT